jgi:hypothetical protein
MRHLSIATPASSCCSAVCSSASASSPQPGDDAHRVQLLFGILIGVAAGSFYAPMMAAASDRCVAHLAVALPPPAWGGTMTVSPIAGLLLGASTGVPPC